jgi:hypothetical protein
MKKKILFLSFYYPPDLSAGSFRSESLVKSLLKKNVKIDLLSTSPNRYVNHTKKVALFEEYASFRIFRVPVKNYSGTLVNQAISFSKYCFGVLRFVHNKDYDLIFATSGRSLTAALGAYIAFKKNIPLYIDTRDLFVDTIKDLYKNHPLRFSLFIFKWLEKKTYKVAKKVNLVSGGFIPYIKENYPNLSYSVFTNGIDPNFKKLKQRKIFPRNSLVVYAGNFGYGQGLHLILPKVAIKCQDYVDFLLIGEGNCLNVLKEEIVKNKISNVRILKPVSRTKLTFYYNRADILFVHLNSHDAFKKVLPSKIFELAATCKPILAGVAGYSSYFIKRHISGAEVFVPCDEKGMIDGIKKILSNTNQINRNSFIKKFKRETIMNNMVKDICSII